MEFWRRWRVVGGVALIGALSSAAAGADLDLAAVAKALSTAKGAPAVAQRTAIVSYADSLPLVAKDSFGSQMVGTPSSPGPIASLLKSSNPDAQLNAAIAIAEVKTLSTDSALEDMLKSNSPAVRYWGAQGLGNIMAPINRVGGGAKARAIGALTLALGTEKSGLVKMQMITAIAKAGDVAPLLAALEALEKQIQGGTADGGTIDAAAAALEQFDPLIRGKGTLSKADSTAIAKAAAWTASFAAQQQVAMKDKRDKEGSDMPEGYATSVKNVVDGAVRVLNDVSGPGIFRISPGDDSPNALLLAVDGLMGSASAGQGDLQKTMPDVPVPPAVSATAPATTSPATAK